MSKTSHGKVKQTPRAVAATILLAVIDDGRSLTAQLGQQQSHLKADTNRALVQELCYGVLRWQIRLEGLAEKLLARPFKQRDRIVHMLVLLGLYQLLYLDKPAHAVIHETVEAARVMDKPWATGVVNAVLRNCQRNAQELLQALDKYDAARFSHPQWLLDWLRKDWPQDWQDIVTANNQRPPMILRVNQRQHSKKAYGQMLADAGIEWQAVTDSESALYLPQPVGVEKLPGFAQGAVSVQDAGAQKTAEILSAQPGERILDACAAPGGKTCHILEAQPAVGEVVALDIDGIRLQQIQENLDRLQLPATLLAADAAEAASWWDGKQFDRILLDAPCSASGVIRRHPDIKVLRRPEDVDQLIVQQQRLLEALWPLLAPGGMLLYVTCSVFKSENSGQMKHFIKSHPDCRVVDLAGRWGHVLDPGRQILPGEQGMDGFYYACIRKPGGAFRND